MNDTVITPCPNCGEQLTIPNNLHMRAKCPRCQSMLEVANGQIVGHTRPQAQQQMFVDPAIKERQKKRRKVLLISLGGLFAVILLYVFVGRDYFAYKKAMKADDEYGIWDCESYERQFPNGFWKTEVMNHKDDLSFEKAKKYAQSDNCEPCHCEYYQEYYLKDFGNGLHAAEAKKAVEECDFKDATKNRDLRKLTAFIEKYPSSSHLAEVKSMREELWNAVIARFDENVKNESSLNPKGAAFFRQVLNFVKDNNQSTIWVRFDHSLNLKDWEDFPLASRQVMDRLVDDLNAMPEYDRGISGTIPRPSDQPPPSLKSYFTAGNIESMEDEVAGAISNSFVDLFKDTILYVKRLDPDSQLHGNPIVIDINYVIQNKWSVIDGVNAPSLYQRTNQQEGSIIKTFDGFILGIGIDFKFKMTLPGNSDPYAFQESAEPAPSLKDINTASDAYQKMTYTAFGDFLGKINRNLGISTYSEDEEEQ